jgi:hypothetical protein
MNLAWMAIAGGAIASGLVVGCGGDDATGLVDADAGADSPTGTDAGQQDATVDEGGDQDAGANESGSDVTTNDSGGNDSGGNDASDGGNDASDGGTDAGQDAGPVCPSDGGTCNCDPVSGNTYYVDPVNGSDTLANGSGKSSGIATGFCAFKTVAKAIATVGGAAAAGTKIFVLGPSTTAATEAFPWDIPTNTALASQGGTVTAKVPTGAVGVRLRQPTSSISGFVLDGGNHAGQNGILVQNNASAANVLISACTVQGFADAGIRVEGTAGVTIGPATRSTGNGVAGAARSGLRITDAGQVVINNPAGDAISFDANSAFGIEIDLQAKIDLTGVPGATIGTGTVVTTGNQLGGLAVGTSPNAAGPPPLSTFTGLVVYNNAVVGAELLGATQVKFRGSRFYNNTIGVRIDTSTVGGVATPDDVSGIDLGKSAAADPGKNVLQSPTNQGANSGVGICVAIQPNKSQTINALGNVWMGTIANGAPQQYDCSTTAAQLTKAQVTACVAGNGTSFGGQGTVGNALAPNLCTTP